MLNRRQAIVTTVLALVAGPVRAQQKLKVIASFTIVGDFVKNVGGERVEVGTLVGPNGNAHVYAPSPADARRIAEAQVVFVNGLGFEGWLDRLVKASGTKAPIVVATRGIKPRERPGGDLDHGRDESSTDPHAWQSVANAKIYVANIRAALIAADPAGKVTYEANAAAYLARLDVLDREVRELVAKIPQDRRRVITGHNAYGYFQDAYGITFLAPQGVSTETEASARGVATLISQVRQNKASAIFMENVTDPRLIRQIANETGAKVGGTLYSDALTEPGGAAPTYIDLIRHNLRQLALILAS